MRRPKVPDWRRGGTITGVFALIGLAAYADVSGILATAWLLVALGALSACALVALSGAALSLGAVESLSALNEN